MRIVADENIPYVREAFGGLGEVITLPGRSMDRASLIDAELLLVRSVTKVNAALLDRGIYGGASTPTVFGHGDADTAVYCVTELHTGADITELADALKEILA